MSSTTPTNEPPSARRTRSKSPRSRPTTPLRPSSRSSLRDSAQRVRGPYNSTTFPLELLDKEFAELSDAMADLEQNFFRLQEMHESLARFSESFAGFLYGLNMNAFCVDFPETPVPESFKRPQNNHNLDFSSSFNRSQNPGQAEPDIEATFLTTDTSFVDNPPSSKATSKFQTPAKQPAGQSKIARGGSGIARGGNTGRGRGAR
ncbi:DASH complex subunit Dam1-domain-containing protein [Lophiotrema nucula]|uniref:DASH complex subunit DAM1 n=1 Tax=Lophiotrema nucula TaxID=690887 RepID=A0A6A5ZU37_9PLEO|nr:DASH complex subunit Dam1-domain-containing protein [Lophiotrema nucula]